MLPENTRIKNTKTLVKFRANYQNLHSRNRIITSTLGKFGFINPQYRGISPQDEEFWLVNIDSMVTRGSPVSGIFILSPICMVERTDINYIAPGLYTTEDEDGIRYVIPRFVNGYWLMSLEDRRPLFDPSIHAIIVVSNPEIEAKPLDPTTLGMAALDPAVPAKYAQETIPYKFSPYTNTQQIKQINDDLDEELGLLP